MALSTEKDLSTHMNEMKWILIGAFAVVAFFVATEPVVESARGPIEAICANTERLNTRNTIDCFIYRLTGRVMNPRVL